jgi:hypothetical protein
LAATALAIRLYVVEHDGELPKSLEELTPTYLGQVPADPMARRGSNLRYVADSKRRIVYGVGCNGQDDGGSDRVKSNYVEYRLSLGEDAVAHLKVQQRKNVLRDEDETNNLSDRGYRGRVGAVGDGSTEGGY